MRSLNAPTEYSAEPGLPRGVGLVPLTSNFGVPGSDRIPDQTKRVSGEGAGRGIQPGPKQRLHQHVFLSSFIYEYRCSPKRFSKEKPRPLRAESVAIPAVPHWETLKILGGDPTQVSEAAPLRECLQEEEEGAQGP